MKKTRLILVLFMVSACAADLQRPPLLIASDATFAPFHLLNEAGEPTGFDIELARAVASHAGFEPEVVVLAYAELFTGLSAGSHDLVAATTGITTEREQNYLFSQPYFTTCQVAVVRTGPMEPRRTTDLNGRRIGASGNGTSASAMRSITGAHVRINDGAGVRSLQEHLIDAWIVDEFDGVVAARDSGGQLRVLRTGIAKEQYGLVLARNRAELQSLLDKSLSALRKNGTLDALSVRFGLQREHDWPVLCQEN